VRISLIIVALAAIAVGLVHLRREQTRVAYQTQRAQIRQVELRRRLCDQQVELGRLTNPQCVRRRASQLDIALTDQGTVRTAQAPGDARR